MEMEGRLDINDDSESYRGSMWDSEQKLDQPMDEEAGKLKTIYREKKFLAILLLRLAFQSLGVVYGDLGTSPLYVFYNTFPKGIYDPEDVIGALSLIIYSLTLVPLLKYVFIVCKANDNGQVLSAAGGIKVNKPGISGGGGRDGFMSLGGIMLSITGTEALFADLAHFPVSAIRLAFTAVVFPCLLLAYSGQAAYLVKNKEHVVDAFYCSIPAAVVASQATISATFSIIKLAHAHGCFPRVKVVHTSKKFLGQIYVPDINWILMILCICVTAGFKNQSQIGNAYGQDGGGNRHAGDHPPDGPDNDPCVALPLDPCCALHRLIPCGGMHLLVIAGAFLIVMHVRHYGTLKRYEFEMHSKVSMAWIIGLGPSLGLVRVPGIGLVYTELASGIPHIFSHFITNLPAIHSVVVFVCVKYLPVDTVSEEERFLVKRIGSKKFRMFRCVARYGYKDLHNKEEEFEKKLFDSLFLFVRLESMMDGCSDSDEYSLYGQQTQHSRDGLLNENGNTIGSVVDSTMSSIDSIMPVKPSVTTTVGSSGQTSSQTEVDEVEFLQSCRDAGLYISWGTRW
ncbi:unnamed protein product [Linum tenue]|uniref:Potassium transporter n=1 Tax=Linum tenue TaxID=586396 RepID=A0AAV0I7I1_9ROSI|nr:unnamed protein product [Linum tenue]